MVIDAEFPENATLEQLLKHIRKVTTDASFPGIPIYVDPIGLAEANSDHVAEIKLDYKNLPIPQNIKSVLDLRSWSEWTFVRCPRRLHDDLIADSDPRKARRRPRPQARPRDRNVRTPGTGEVTDHMDPMAASTYRPVAFPMQAEERTHRVDFFLVAFADLGGRPRLGPAVATGSRCFSSSTQSFAARAPSTIPVTIGFFVDIDLATKTAGNTHRTRMNTTWCKPSVTGNDRRRGMLSPPSPRLHAPSFAA